MNISKKLLLIMSMPIFLAGGSVFAGKKGKKKDNRNGLTPTERKAARERNAKEREAARERNTKKETLKSLLEEKNQLSDFLTINDQLKNNFNEMIDSLNCIELEQQNLSLVHEEIREKNKSNEIASTALYSMLDFSQEVAGISFSSEQIDGDSPEFIGEQIQLNLFEHKVTNLEKMNDQQLDKQLEIALYFMQSGNNVTRLLGAFRYHLINITINRRQKEKTDVFVASLLKALKQKNHPLTINFFQSIKDKSAASLLEKKRYELYIEELSSYSIKTKSELDTINQKITALRNELSCPSDYDTIDAPELRPTIVDTDLERSEPPIQQKKNWAKLEEEPLALILNYLDHASFEASEKTCKNWQAIAKSEALKEIRKTKKNEKALSTTKDGICISQDNRWLVKIETPWADYIFYKLCPQQEPTQLDLPQFTYDETPGRPGSYVGVWGQERPEWQEYDQSCKRVTRRNIAHKLFKTIPHIADYLLESDDLVFKGIYKDNRNREIPTKSIIGCIVPKTIAEDDSIIIEQGIDCVYEWGFIPTANPAARPICYHRCARAVPSATQLEREVLSREENTTLPENWDLDAEFPQSP